MKGVREREGDFRSLCLIPTLMGIGHLPPAVGALLTVGGDIRNETALLVMVASTSAMVDALDKYKDLPPHARPRRWIWRSWVTILVSVAGLSTYMCGLQTAIQIHRFLSIGILWGIPCIPTYSSTTGFRIIKPKAMIREAKSLIVAVCMGFVCAQTSMYKVCMVNNAACSSIAIQRRSLCLAILYQFIRETVCDARDIDEDTKENLNTLPVLLDRRMTMIFLLFVGISADTFLTGGITLSWEGVSMAWDLVLTSVMRAAVTIAFSSIVLRYPRDHHVAWGSMALLGLLPVLPAQLALT